MNEDLISRRLAIDSIMAAGKIGKLTCCDILRKLPSAQPEIVRCKDCKHWRDSDGVYRRGSDAESKCHLNTKDVYAGTFYCGYAERRTDEIDSAIEITAWMPLPEPYEEGAK